MAKTVACIAVNNTRAFSWLGHLPALNWCLEQLVEVRGIDSIVCATTPELAGRAGELLVDEVAVLPVPQRVLADDAALDSWLCAADGPAALADVVVVVRPTAPFLPAGKVEACLDFVRRNLADTCCTATAVRAWLAGNRVSVHAEVPGCRAFAPARMASGKPRFRPVPVSTIESLDISDPDNFRVAAALVQTGEA